MVYKDSEKFQKNVMTGDTKKASILKKQYFRQEFPSKYFPKNDILFLYYSKSIIFRKETKVIKAV